MQQIQHINSFWEHRISKTEIVEIANVGKMAETRAEQS